jgi:hypothetical protein
MLSLIDCEGNAVYRHPGFVHRSEQVGDVAQKAPGPLAHLERLSQAVHTDDRVIHEPLLI